MNISTLQYITIFFKEIKPLKFIKPIKEKNDFFQIFRLEDSYVNYQLLSFKRRK
jgi:hypothetical protein